MTMQKRVAVTGLGLVSPLGKTVADNWAALMAGQSGIGAITAFDAAAFSARVAGEVRDFDPTTTGLEPKELKKADRFIHLGLAAAREAMAQAGLAGLKDAPKAMRERVAVLMGTGIGGLQSTEATCATLAERGPGRISPFFIPAMLPNLLGGQVSMMFGAQGANVCPVSACATSAHAVGWGARLINWGEAEVVICGGAEAAVCPSAVGGFAAMRALSTKYNDTPAAASRPFDAGRDGFVMGEGAGVMILEAEDHAKARGATILGYVDGFGQTGDAANLTLPSEGGEGAVRAMRAALADAGLGAGDIGYINAHATSTPLGDDLEAGAIAGIFGSTVPVSSTKGATGHLLGAAGVLEAIVSLMALREGRAPGTLNLENPTFGGLNLPTSPVALNGARHALSNSFGFGGTNAALVVSV